MSQPNLYIISGCNGAGKTTASFTVLPDILNCKEFLNADEIAKGLSPFQPETVSIEAGRIMLGRIKDLLRLKVDFAFETTLATKVYAKYIQDAQARGYTVTLLYFWLKHPDLAVERVKSRVLSGGHHIPEDTIRRRYDAGLINLSKLYMPICDSWMIINNTVDPFQKIAQGNKLLNLEIFDNEPYHQIIR